MEMTIRANSGVMTLVNVFAVDPDNQHKLVEALKEGTEGSDEQDVRLHFGQRSHQQGWPTRHQLFAVAECQGHRHHASESRGRAIHEARSRSRNVRSDGVRSQLRPSRVVRWWLTLPSAGAPPVVAPCVRVEYRQCEPDSHEPAQLQEAGAAAQERLRLRGFEGTKRLPIHDEPHVRNALSRFNQVAFEDEAARERARKRLLEAAKKYGIVPIGFMTGQLR